MSNKNDNAIIRNAMIILFVALLIVYVALYQTKGDQIRDVLAGDVQDIGPQEIQIVEPTPETNTLANILQDTGSQNIIDSSTVDTGTTITTPDDDIQIEEPTIEEPTETEDDTLTDIILLSGTSLYFGPIEAVDELGIPYTYALQDDRNIYYLNLGDQEIDLAGIARVFDGSIYVMNTAQEIINNQLFGDKITFINIPQYQNNIVLMIVDIADQQWLVHINFSIYHESKSYLESLFTELY